MLSLCPSGFLSTEGTRATMRSLSWIGLGSSCVFYQLLPSTEMTPLPSNMFRTGLEQRTYHGWPGPQEDVALLTSDTILDDVKAACILRALHWGYEARQTPKIRFGMFLSHAMAHPRNDHSKSKSSPTSLVPEPPLRFHPQPVHSCRMFNTQSDMMCEAPSSTIASRCQGSNPNPAHTLNILRVS